MNTSSRQLSPYEQTHLARFGFSRSAIDHYGEMPVEYITGKVEFMGKVLDVTQDTLIPRVETEELVDHAYTLLRSLNRDTAVVADVGTGCGAVGISLYAKWVEEHAATEKLAPLTLYMSDISDSALAVAKKNVETHITNPTTIHILHSDLLASFPSDALFDLIVANLPYIPTDRIRVLDSSVKDFEPHLALDGGSDGLRYVRALITQAVNHMTPNGYIVLEVDYTHDYSFLHHQLDLTAFTLQMHTDVQEGTRFAILQKK